MPSFEIYTPANAPSGSAGILSSVADKLGFLPNVFAVLGGSPPALAAFAALNGQFAASSLTSIEREIVQTAVSVRNNSAYCVAGHTAFAQAQDLDQASIGAVRGGAAVSNPKQQALRRFAERLVETRGRGTDADVAAFLAAGYRPDQVFDVILGIAVKVFSNLTSNVTGIPLDPAFAPFSWAPVEAVNDAA